MSAMATPSNPAATRIAPTHPAWATAQRVVALFACILLAPVWLLLYVLVKLDSPGPFLFRQRRPGLNGHMFDVLKIRSMTVGSERNTQLGLGVTKHNPAVTKVGRVLRELKLDELPQLWNVVRGEMEFVGPRPIAPVLRDTLARVIPDFHLREQAKPGLTCVGQVMILDNAVGDAMVADWALRFEGELHYLRHKSTGHDLLLIGLTALFILRKMWRKLTRGASGEPAGARST